VTPLWWYAATASPSRATCRTSSARVRYFDIKNLDPLFIARFTVFHYDAAASVPECVVYITLIDVSGLIGTD